MWCGYHFIHSNDALLEAGGSWAWTIENGQYYIQSDGIDTNWYTNGSLHKGCFQYYHWRYWYAGQAHYPLIASAWEAASPDVSIKSCGMFCADDAIVAYSGYGCGSHY